MNLIVALLCVMAAPPVEDDEYLGRLMYRITVERNYSMDNYQRDKEKYLKMSEEDRRALVYANRIRSQQSLRMYRGTDDWMRIEQTAPLPSLPRNVYPQPWNYPLYRPYSYYYNPYVCPSFQYRVIIH
jgi:hypothetical protein